MPNMTESGPAERLVKPEIITKGVEKALKQVSNLEYRKGAAPEEEHGNLEFHNIDHTNKVVSRFELISGLLRKNGVKISEREIQIGKLAAAFHDVVQNFAELEVEDLELNPDGQKSEFYGNKKLVRKRDTGKNEELSADAAVQYMQEVNEEKPNTFNENDKLLVRKIIMITVPGFNSKQGTVVQPNLKQESSVTERILALSDLGTVGIEDGEEFLKEGLNLFKEENLDIADVINNREKMLALPDETKNYFRHRVVKWMRDQVSFAKGRKIVFKDVIAPLPMKVQEALRNNIFNKFDSAIEAAEKSFKELQDLNFEEVINKTYPNLV